MVLLLTIKNTKMKKIYLMLASAMLFSGAFSQAPLNVQKIQNNNTVHKAMPTNKVVTKITSDLLPENSTFGTRATTINENINSIDYVTTFLGSTPYLAYTNPIFPDTNVIVAWSSGPGSPWLHGIAQTFDLGGGYLKSIGSQFDPTVQPFDEDGTTTIDSIWIQGFYSRPDAGTVDTAIISIFADNHGNYTRGFNISAPDSTILVVDDINRDNAPDSAIWTGKIILNSAFKVDTLSNGGNMFIVAPGINVANYNGIVGVSLEFKPGSSYSQASDTIFSNQNYINVVYATPQGQTTTFPLGQTASDVTSGSFSNNSTKYNTGTSRNYYQPAIAFVGDHPYQLYDISMKISQTNTLTASIKELDNGAKLFQNYPNPTNGNTTIKYSLENNANVSFEMMDVTGKVVLTSNEGDKGNGMHMLNVNTSELTAGIYFYSLIVNNHKMTKKMTITK